MHNCWDEIAGYTEFELFRMAFLEDFVERDIESSIEHQGVLQMAQVHFFMACFQGIADRLSHIMSLSCFIEISMVMQLTNQQMPLQMQGFVDQFHKVRSMINNFNHHYAKNYHPLWINCLNESMNSWLS